MRDWEFGEGSLIVRYTGRESFLRRSHGKDDKATEEEIGKAQSIDRVSKPQRIHLTWRFNKTSVPEFRIVSAPVVCCRACCVPACCFGNRLNTKASLERSVWIMPSSSLTL